MIVSDYGETIVHTNSEINPLNIDAIREYQKKGGVFALATGREWPSIKQKISRPSFDAVEDFPIICCYGAIVITSRTEKVLFSQPLDNDLVVKILSILDRYQYSYSVVTCDNTYVKSSIDLSNYPWKKYGNQIVVNDLDEVIEIINMKHLNVYKIDVYQVENVGKLNNLLNEDGLSNLKYFANSSGLVEYVDTKAGKGSSFSLLVDYYSLHLNEVVVLGDAPNDIELFSNAKNKLAVNNAIESLKEVSSSIIDNTDYLGLYRIIRQILDVL